MDRRPLLECAIIRKCQHHLAASRVVKVITAEESSRAMANRSAGLHSSSLRLTFKSISFDIGIDRTPPRLSKWQSETPPSHRYSSPSSGAGR